MSATLPSLANVCAIIQREDTCRRLMDIEPKSRDRLVESLADKINFGNQTSINTRFNGVKGKGCGRNTKFHCRIVAKMGIYRTVVGIFTLTCDLIRTGLQILELLVWSLLHICKHL